MNRISERRITALLCIIIILLTVCGILIVNKEVTEIVHIHVYVHSPERALSITEAVQEIVHEEVEEIVHEEVEEAPRYGFTDEDIYLLAQLLGGDKNIDGDGEYDIDFKTNIDHIEVNKVLGVVMNRVRSKDFPNTVNDVVLQKGQFSVMPRNLEATPSEVGLNTVRAWCEAYDIYDLSVQTTPESHLYFTGNGVINITREHYR